MKKCFHQGRMLHLLPSTVKKEKADASDAGAPGSSSYKRQKDAKTKALSSKYVDSYRSINFWQLNLPNTSFLVPIIGTLYFWAPMQWLMPSLKNTARQKAKFLTTWATTHLIPLHIISFLFFFFNHKSSQWSFSGLSKCNSQQINFGLTLVSTQLNACFDFAGVKGKCCSEDGFGRDADCSGDPAVSTIQQCQLGLLQPGVWCDLKRILSESSKKKKISQLFPAVSSCTGCVQAAAPRSTTVILVKNLPAGVASAELEELFSAHGSLGRVLLPPSGLTAIVEFLEPTEAKRAFTRLAYSKVRCTSDIQ